MKERGLAAGGVHLKMTEAPTPRNHRGTAWSSTRNIGLGCTRKDGETIAFDFFVGGTRSEGRRDDIKGKQD